MFWIGSAISGHTGSQRHSQTKSDGVYQSNSTRPYQVLRLVACAAIVIATDKLFTKFFHSYVLYTLFYI
ncbi:hypothetical protein SERLA73DRAFT_141533 [Serpula lacrymans var. lacrymans S7.3]|uniref:Uncharacterized protein n=1 Tax=Serpula lacrymans var. lacrymans (strain S7.3) TaxID=936435 RepID=F8Q6J9_SERL3|nr:hypothetical protein SERLA73DRAFT_141533 [Serpula lacrymans var. lacrymans S7.3]